MQELQLSEDMPFQRKTWAAERVAWIVIALLIFAATLGLFSNGPLSSAAVEDGNGVIRVEYARFERLAAPSSLRVVAALPSDAGETFRLRIGKNFADNFEIDQIQPLPEEAIVEADGMVLVFRIAAPDAPSTIYLSITPQGFGLVNSGMGIDGRGSVRFTQFVYP